MAKVSILSWQSWKSSQPGNSTGMQVTAAHVLQEYGACSASQQALQVQDQEELQKLVTMLPERLATTVLEQPDFSQVCPPGVVRASMCSICSVMCHLS